MDKRLIISVASNPFMGPRYKEFGEYSGEWFRDSIFIPWLKDLKEEGIVDFDGIEVFSPSFLDEGIASVYKKEYGLEEQLEKIRFEHISSRWITLLNMLIAEAKDEELKESRLKKYKASLGDFNKRVF